MQQFREFRFLRNIRKNLLRLIQSLTMKMNRYGADIWWMTTQLF